MKPPQAVNRGRACLLLLAASLMWFASCRQEADQSSPPTQKQPPDATIESTGPSAESPDEEPAAEPEGPSLEAPMNQPSPEEPSPAEPSSSPAPVPSTEEPAATPQPEPPSPAETSPGPPSETPPVDTPSQPPAEVEKPAPAAAEGPSPSAEPEAPPATPATLGPPLGEDVAKLTPLQPKPTVWVDKKTHRVIAVGQVCQRNAPLEMFACPSGTKEHEAVVAIPAESKIIHAALLRVGAVPGAPVKFYPEYSPATGTEIAIDVRWKDKKGKVQTAKAQDWIRNIATKKPMEHNWVFGGSNFWKDEETGQEHYSADSGDLICVSNFPSATLDLPIESSQSDANLMFEAFTENIPPLGTPVTIILKPKLDKKPAKEPAKAAEKKPE